MNEEIFNRKFSKEIQINGIPEEVADFKEKCEKFAPIAEQIVLNAILRD